MTKRDQFTPATSKFIARKDDEPVVGWVSASVPIERDHSQVPARAVVLTREDERVLALIHEIVAASTAGPEPLATDEEKMLKLLVRLIGR